MLNPVSITTPILNGDSNTTIVIVVIAFIISLGTFLWLTETVFGDK